MVYATHPFDAVHLEEKQQDVVCKDTINCPEKLMKISHFDQTNQCILSILG